MTTLLYPVEFPNQDLPPGSTLSYLTLLAHYGTEAGANGSNAGVYTTLGEDAPLAIPAGPFTPLNALGVVPTGRTVRFVSG